MKQKIENNILVSIVIPAYNEAGRIGSSLKRLYPYCEKHFAEFELLCVDDGSTDSTWEVISRWSVSPHIRGLRLDQNRGKGFAVTYGMRHAKGAFRFFTDADLPYAPDAFLAAMDRFRTGGCDVVTGDRDIYAGKGRQNSGIIRRFAGCVFSFLTTHLVKVDVRDTQCGFKGFSGEAAELLFPKIKTAGYTFDVELFGLAKIYDLRVCKIPVRLIQSEGSKIRMTIDPLFMFVDLLRVARRLDRARR
jgi:dolichyl-phosphate beta-glucosyltransferase